MDDEVKKTLCSHDCNSTRRSGKVKIVTKFWICDKVKDWLLDDKNLGAKELQRRIKDKYKVEVNYTRVYQGKELALKQLYGDWDKSFDNLYRFKEQIEASSPGSIVAIDHHTINGKIRFNRLFFAMKPCIDGFLQGCRPYLAIDSTFLTGKFRGQLCIACAVDGHNWMYPVAIGVIDSETNENWIWFMERLKEAIGIPAGLAFCTDCGQAVMAGVHEVFPTAEHRECMGHLVQDFKKRYTGKVFDDHLWLAAYSWHPYWFEKHWQAMATVKPEAMRYLQQNHNKLWTRSQFSTLCKVDYVTNNLAEVFNSWIEADKGQHLDDLMDTFRQKLMVKWNIRRKIANKMKGKILKHIRKNLQEHSRNLDMEVYSSSDRIAEVCVRGINGCRNVVNLDDKICSCRQWQLSGKPCSHAIAFITSLRTEKLEDYVDMCFSVEKFRAAYQGVIPALPDKSVWPKSSHGFFMYPPLLKSTSGRRKQSRFKGSKEGGQTSTKGRHRCPICKQYGHHWNNCKNGDPEDIAAMLAGRGPPKKNEKKAVQASTETSVVLASAPKMIYPQFSCNNTTPSTKKRKRTPTSSSGTYSSVRLSGSGSNQLEDVTNSIVFPPAKSDQPSGNGNKKGKKRQKEEDDSVEKKTKGKKNAVDNETTREVHSPAMGTRSKVPTFLSSPAMGTRSKRRLSI